MVYPITAHAMGHQLDEDGGFVVEATTIQDPIGFATTLEDETARSTGASLVEAVRAFRRWIGLLAMVNDDNNGSVSSARTASSRTRPPSPTSSWTHRRLRSTSPARSCSRPAHRASAGRG